MNNLTQNIFSLIFGINATCSNGQPLPNCYNESSYALVIGLVSYSDDDGTLMDQITPCDSGSENNRRCEIGFTLCVSR